MLPKTTGTRLALKKASRMAGEALRGIWLLGTGGILCPCQKHTECGVRHAKDTRLPFLACNIHTPPWDWA